MISSATSLFQSDIGVVFWGGFVIGSASSFHSSRVSLVFGFEFSALEKYAPYFSFLCGARYDSEKLIRLLALCDWLEQ